MKRDMYTLKMNIKEYANGQSHTDYALLYINTTPNKRRLQL